MTLRDQNFSEARDLSIDLDAAQARLKASADQAQGLPQLTIFDGMTPSTHSAAWMPETKNTTA